VRRILALLVVGLCCVQCGDDEDRGTNADGGEFGIFLTRDDVPPTQLIAMSHIEAAADPILSIDDIAAYVREEHGMVLSASGRSKLDSLQVPVKGRSFLVCVDGQVRYAGAFWTMISSASFDGPVIVLPAMNDTVRIEIGYPGRVEGREYEDPRDEPDVMAALAGAGKLR